MPNYHSKCDHDHLIKRDRCDNISSVINKVSKFPFGSDIAAELKLVLEQIEKLEISYNENCQKNLARTDMFDNLSDCFEA